MFDFNNNMYVVLIIINIIMGCSILVEVNMIGPWFSHIILINIITFVY